MTRVKDRWVLFRLTRPRRDPGKRPGIEVIGEPFPSFWLALEEANRLDPEGLEIQVTTRERVAQAKAWAKRLR